MAQLDLTLDVEALLIARIAGGDVSALADLYDRYASVLLGITFRIVNNRSVAEDVVHDLFVSLHDRSQTYDRSRGPVGAWLITMARNLSIDRVRKSARRRRLDQTNQVTEHSLPVDFVDAGAVREALHTLPDDQKVVVEAAFFEGLSYAEIADREGVPLGTIKSRAARAFGALRALLSGPEHPTHAYLSKEPRGVS